MHRLQVNFTSSWLLTLSIASVCRNHDTHIANCCKFIETWCALQYKTSIKT